VEKAQIKKASAKNAWGLGRDVLFLHSLSNFRAIQPCQNLPADGNFAACFTLEILRNLLAQRKTRPLLPSRRCSIMLPTTTNHFDGAGYLYYLRAWNRLFSIQVSRWVLAKNTDVT